MLKLGLTGGVGAGKSTVASFLKERGARFLNTDLVARETMRPGSRVWKRLVREFGDEILLENREIDRKRLSEIVFRHPRRLRRLEAIVHPEVVRSLKRWFAKCRAKGAQVAVVEVPLLYEAGLEKLFDFVVAVTAPKPVLLERCEKRGMSRADAAARMRAQMSQAEKARRADHVIVNKGSKQTLKLKVRKLLKKIKHPF